jgi:rRNA maturation endonuclease Nob1
MVENTDPHFLDEIYKPRKHDICPVCGADLSKVKKCNKKDCEKEYKSV